MKLQTVERSVDMQGFGDARQQEFRIKNNAKAFKILSSNLYKDKILAVIRELGCNAYDAHVAAGTQDIAFNVHLPNNLEPHFSIRDFGTGLSEDDIFSIYTTYFESTKADSNEAVGCLGLGSKSPFAYVDQFQVISYFNGERKMYTALLSREGTPTIMKTFEEPTTEPNGIEIYMAVQPEDFSTFADRARKVFHRFPVLPNLSGNRHADLTQVRYVLEGPNYKVRGEDPKDLYNEGSGAYAVQGVVAYPLSSSEIDIELTDQERNLINYMDIDISFPIGELDIAASREELSYDKITQQNIVNALKTVIADVPNHAKNILDAAANRWEAKKLHARWCSNVSDESKFMREILGETLDWKGEKIEDSMITLKMFDHKTIEDNKSLLATIKNATSEAGINVVDSLLQKTQVDNYGDVVYFSETNLNGRPTKKLHCSYHAEVKIDAGKEEKQVIVWLDDPKLSRGINPLIHHNYRGKRVSVYVIRPEDGFKDKIIEQFEGFTNFVMASTLEPVPKAVKGVYSKPDIRKFYEYRGAHNANSSYLNIEKVETEHDVTKGGIYLVSYQGGIITPGQEWLEKGKTPESGNDSYERIMAMAYDLGWLGDDDNGEPNKVFIFNSTHKNIIKKYAGWTNAWDIVKTKAKEFAKDDSLFADMERSVYKTELQEGGTLIDSLYDYSQEWAEVLQHVKSTSKIHEFYDEVMRVKTEAIPDSVSSENLEGRRRLLEAIADAFKIKTVDMSKPSAKAKKRAEKLITKAASLYPSLVHMTGEFRLRKTYYNYATGDEHLDKKGLALYIKMCDSNRKDVKEFLSQVNKPIH